MLKEPLGLIKISGQSEECSRPLLFPDLPLPETVERWEEGEQDFQFAQQDINDPVGSWCTCVLSSLLRLQTQRSTPPFQNPNQTQKMIKRQTKSKLKINNLQIRNITGEIKSFYRNINPTNFSSNSFHFFIGRTQQQTGKWWKKEENLGAILQSQVPGPCIYTEGKGYKELSDQKNSLFCPGGRSYGCHKPVRTILT